MRRIPAEWEQQASLLLTWPHRPDDWECGLESVEQVYLDVIRAVIDHQAVRVLTANDAKANQVRQLVRDGAEPGPRLHTHVIPTDDIWIQDYGPMQVEVEQELHWIDWRFDGWGGKFPAATDDGVTRKFARALRLPLSRLTRLELAAEGGNLENDGDGGLLTQADCLYSGSRNAPGSRARIRAVLREQCGIQRMMELRNIGLLGDDTDGHIDNLARFCDDETIVYAESAAEDVEQARQLDALEPQLRTLRTASGSSYRLVPLRLPRPIRNRDGNRLPASYVNFVITNQKVLIPAFNDPSDDGARLGLQQCFPGRQVQSIPATPLLYQYGGLHCATLPLFRTS